MKKILILFGVLLCVGLNAQTLQTSSITLVDEGGGNYHLLDSITYSNGSIIITRTATLDSSAMDAFIVSDSLSAHSNYTSETTTYSSYASKIASFQALKTTDSLEKEYYLDRRTDYSSALSSLRTP